MIDVVLLILRYCFLAMFYLFLFKLTLAILADLRRPPEETAIQLGSPGGDGAALVVLFSSDEQLEPDTQIPLGNKTLFGRTNNSDIKIQDNFVSAKHAQITYRDHQYWLEDLGSLNGTYLNEIKIDKATAIADGDRIRVGGVSFQFVRWAYEMGPDY
ncbi:FHA domain-containing protein [Peptococcaceae bacterium 1198_IL3148]